MPLYWRGQFNKKIANMAVTVILAICMLQLSCLNYLAGVSTGVGTSLFSIVFLIPDSSIDSPLGIAKFDNKINAIKTKESVQVLLSRKSEVLCTPPKVCAPPPNEDDNPPPLGF